MKHTKGRLKKGHVTATATASAGGYAPIVAPPTTPYSIFQCSIERAKNLLKIHKLAHGAQSRPPAFLADAHRAAIVLAVSALDAFIRTLVVKQVLARVTDVSQTIPERLRNQIKELLGQDALLDAARHADLTSRIDKAFRERLEEQSFQGVKNILDAMRLIGYEDVFETIARAASVNEENLKGDLGRFTKRRHIIAHCSDYDLTQNPPLENRILKKDAEDCIAVVELIAKEINKLR